MPQELTEADILMRLTNVEDATVERKTARDYRDCRKTAVAFSNSLPIDDPGIIYVGVFDDGRIEENNLASLESLLLKVSSEIARIYPPIYTQARVFEKDGKKFLAVIVRGSSNRPHFAGPSYVRDGTKTVEASESQFDKLIAERNSTAYEILRWKGKAITLTQPVRELLVHGTTQWHPGGLTSATVIDCNQHFVTLENVAQASDRASYPLRIVELSYDNGRKRLELRLLEGSIPDWPAHL